MTAAFLINPQSRGGGKKGKHLAGVLAASGLDNVVVLNEFGKLRETLEAFADQQVTALFISSGDGTVQAIQTMLAEEKIFAKNPELALLPHGSTNMDALTLGLGLKDPHQIASLSQDLGKAKRKHRRTIRIVNPADGQPRHGMFVGAGALRNAVQFTQDSVNKKNVRGGLAPFVTLMTFVGDYLISSRHNSIARGHPMHIEVEGEEYARGDQLAFLATTLDKLVLGSRPYWGPDHCEMKVLSVGYPPPPVLRYIWPLMWGFPNRNLPQSCRSRSAEAVEISGVKEWIVDGEYFEAPEGVPLRLELGTEFTYLQAP